MDDKLEKAIKKAMKPKGMKALEKKLTETHELSDALYTIKREAQTRITLNKTRKLCNKDII